MKRVFMAVLSSVLALTACERYPDEADAPRDQPGTSLQELQEATTDDPLLDNTTAQLAETGGTTQPAASWAQPPPAVWWSTPS